MVNRNRNKIISLVLSCLIMGFCSIARIEYQSFISLVLIVLSVIVDATFPIPLYIFSVIIKIPFSQFEIDILLVFISLVSAKLFLIDKRRGSNKDKLLFILWCLIIIISSFAGVQTQTITAVVLSSGMLLFFAISSESKNRMSLYIMVVYLLAGIFMGLYSAYLVLTGEASYYGVRLAYGDGTVGAQIKELAIPLAFSLYIIFYFLFFGGGSRFHKLFLIVLLLVLLYILIITYARGALIGLIGSVLFLVFKTMRKPNIIGFVSLAVVGLSLVFIVEKIELEQDVMYSNIGSAGGRSTIWLNFFNMLQENPSRIFFGFGPGDLKRVTIGTQIEGYYAHSAIFDYFFSLGIFAFILLLYMLFITIRNLWKNKDVFFGGLLIADILIFIPHGTVGNTIFLTLFAICYGSSLAPNQFFVFNRSTLVQKQN